MHVSVSVCACVHILCMHVSVCLMVGMCERAYAHVYVCMNSVGVHSYVRDVRAGVLCVDGC